MSKDVTQTPADEAAAALRAQIRSQIRMLKNQKEQFPKSIDRLKGLAAQENVVAAFGDEIGSLKAAIAELE